MTRKLTKKYLWLPLLLCLSFPLGVLAMENEDCLGCHNDRDSVGEELFIDAQIFDHTVHAALGCVACHESVTEEHPDDGLSPSKAVCLDCHSEVNDEYAGSVHAENASCGDCHNPHQVRGLADVSGHDLNQQCAACHDGAEMVQQHAVWLTQADLHLAMLPCISCHTASEENQIVLYIIQKESDAVFGDFVLSEHADLQQLAGEKAPQRLIDLNGDSFISLTELRTFHRKPANQNLRLQATLMPKEVTHRVDIRDNRYDCSFCHAAGPESMQTSVLALPTAAGSYQRFEVERGAVLDALYGTPDFYMMGTTRSASLNILGLLIIIGGTLMPLGHGALRFLTRKNRSQKGE